LHGSQLPSRHHYSPGLSRGLSNYLQKTRFYFAKIPALSRKNHGFPGKKKKTAPDSRAILMRISWFLAPISLEFLLLFK